jgi:mono/diheme cytochrome c family protein
LARELKGLVAGLAAGLGVVGASYGVSAIVVHGQAVQTVSQAKSVAQAPGVKPASTQLVASGAALYSSLACIGCHGAQAQGGGIGPTLHHLGDPDAKVARNIANGFPGKMPAYKNQLSTAQIHTLVAYIQSFE